MLIVGCGHIGQRVAAQQQASGRPVTGLVRSRSSAEKIGQMGIEPYVADLDSPINSLPLPDDGQIFYLAPPPAIGTDDTRMAHFLAAVEQQDRFARIVYISTTGVYGDCQGDWVDENAPLKPEADRARRRVNAEERLRAWKEKTAGELVILRVAGIYGPGKLPLERLRKQLPMISEPQAPWTNRIHTDDLVQACIAAMSKGRDGEVYNITDGIPGNMADYFNRVADAANLPRPPVIDITEAGDQLSPGLISYLKESRRIDNHKMLHELGVTLHYPNLQMGLASCFTENTDSL